MTTLSSPRSALPGFRLTLGITLAWIGIIVLIPLFSLTLQPWTLGASGIWAVMTDPRVLAALRLSFGGALLAAAINLPLGLLIAFVAQPYILAFLYSANAPRSVAARGHHRGTAGGLGTAVARAGHAGPATRGA